MWRGHRCVRQLNDVLLFRGLLCISDTLHWPAMAEDLQLWPNISRISIIAGRCTLADGYHRVGRRNTAGRVYREASGVERKHELREDWSPRRGEATKAARERERARDVKSHDADKVSQDLSVSRDPENRTEEARRAAAEASSKQLGPGIFKSRAYKIRMSDRAQVRGLLGSRYSALAASSLKSGRRTRAPSARQVN